MRRLSIEKRIRHLQAELVRLSMTAGPRREQLSRTLLKSIEIERRNLRMVIAS